MSKHRKHKHSHRHRRGTSVDSFNLERNRLYHDGKEYKYHSYTSALTPCTWTRIHSDGRRESIDTTRGNQDLDNVLLHAYEEQLSGYTASESESSESSDESGSESGENEEAPKKSKTPPVAAVDAAGEIKRDKYGVKLFSNDSKHFLQFAVNNSKNFPGRFSVRLHVGVPKTYTFRKEEMRALLREVARAFSPKERRELL
jgi:hypothetical protein